MNCPAVYTEEICQTPCEINSCTDEHLTTFCPPVCKKCYGSSSSCCTPCGSSSSCCTPCGSSNSCYVVDTCDSSAICCKPTNSCLKRYEILKHVNRCPPKPNCMGRCNQVSRTSYKPVIKCEVACGLPCYETIYMKAFNTPEACCPKTTSICNASCCTLGC